MHAFMLFNLFACKLEDANCRLAITIRYYDGKWIFHQLNKVN